jgi:hypothetical protein
MADEGPVEIDAGLLESIAACTASDAASSGTDEGHRDERFLCLVTSRWLYARLSATIIINANYSPDVVSLSERFSLLKYPLAHRQAPLQSLFADKTRLFISLSFLLLRYRSPWPSRVLTDCLCPTVLHHASAMSPSTEPAREKTLVSSSIFLTSNPCQMVKSAKTVPPSASPRCSNTDHR